MLLSTTHKPGDATLARCFLYTYPAFSLTASMPSKPEFDFHHMLAAFLSTIVLPLGLFDVFQSRKRLQEPPEPVLCKCYSSEILCKKPALLLLQR